jgi:broad specificity phosphatase PhoE
VSTLTLVRHGQAQAFQKKTAALSGIGEQQAAALARWWLAAGVSFDEVYTGSLPRQTHTEQIVARTFSEAGEPWPQACCDPSWNEYDAPGVLARMVPASPYLAALAADFEAARGTPDQNRRFQRMFEAAMLAWLHGEIDADDVELWPAFRDRVSAALAQIVGGPPSRRVAIFTSGGPIGFTAHYALQAPPRSFLEINWRIRNTSLTQFIFDRERLTLDSFNCISHLDPDLRTYR